VSPAVAGRPRLFRDSSDSFGTGSAPRRTRGCSDGGRLTLEQRLDRVWEGLPAAGVAEATATATATCPVCQGRMRRRGSVCACDSCGSQLS
jgi:hypothetical protein